MITYSVTYTHIPTRITDELHNVTADGFNESHGSRYFVRRDNSRIEISVRDMIFVFSPERAKIIEENKKLEAVK